MPIDIDGRVILTRLDSIQSDVKDIKQDLRSLNGTVRENCKEIAILKVTSLRVDAIKISAIIGAVVVLAGVLLKVSGLW